MDIVSFKLLLGCITKLTTAAQILLLVSTWQVQFKLF